MEVAFACFFNMKDFIIITNNPLVSEKYGGTYNIIYNDESPEEVLIRVRDEIHKGRTLLTHPLYGSIKPNETLYRSVMVSGRKGPQDEDSIVLIEDSIITWRKFGPVRRKWHEAELQDFMMVDETLIRSGIESAVLQP